MIQLDLFLAFLQVGAFSVGGGYAAIPLIQSIAVECYGWLSAKEFSDLITIAEMTPGPIGINSSTFVGLRMGGVTGALAAMLGNIAPSLVLVTLLAWFYSRSREGQTMQTILQLLRAVMVALIGSAAISLARSAILANGALLLPMLLLFIAALLLLRIKKVSPILVMAGCGVFGAILHLFHLI